MALMHNECAKWAFLPLPSQFAKDRKAGEKGPFRKEFLKDTHPP